MDYWWLDWQQGEKSGDKNIDPLWLLNHFHYLDNKRKNRIPAILSRYAGAGAHRYPVGFSGDTKMTWKTLEYIPYFTACASNIGYGWWSHDIGGHMHGITDGELYLRFLQFGVFSPINRLHTTSAEVVSKEPWMFENGIAQLAAEFLRLRHRMIPFLYACSYRTFAEGLALIEPMYYCYPEDENCYAYKNQYFFGGQLLVAPITKRSGQKGLVTQKVYLPKGEWTDIFTGDVYVSESGKVFEIVRSLDSIPVFAKSGGIFVTAGERTGNDCALPKALNIDIYKGEGAFKLYEDDGLGGSGITHIESGFCGGMQTVKISFSGEKEVIPKNRRIVIKFKNEESTATVIENYSPLLTYEFNAEFKDADLLERLKGRTAHIITKFQADNFVKNDIYLSLMKAASAEEYRETVEKSTGIPACYKKRLTEII